MRTPLQCEYSGNNIRINFPEDAGTEDLYVHITKPDGTEAIIPRAAQIAMETVRWEPKRPLFYSRMISSGREVSITAFRL